MEVQRLQYVYDFGDNWEHELEFVRIEEHSTGILSICVMGSGDAPPEDVGGNVLFEEFLKVIQASANKEYEQTKQWAEMQRWSKFDRDNVNEQLKFM